MVRHHLTNISASLKEQMEIEGYLIIAACHADPKDAEALKVIIRDCCAFLKPIPTLMKAREARYV